MKILVPESLEEAGNGSCGSLASTQIHQIHMCKFGGREALSANVAAAP